MNEKERRLAAFCEENRYDGVYLRRRSNIAWLTDGADVHCDTGSPLGVASVLWTPRKKVVLTDTIEARRLADEEFSRSFSIGAVPWWESVKAPRGRYATDFPEDTIAELRFSLTRPEVERIRALGGECGEVVGRLMKRVRRGWTEHKIAGQLACALREREIHSPVLLVAADERIARYRHPIPTARALDRTLMVVLCAQRGGLIVCLTRIAHFGKLPRELRRRHEAVCKVDAALHAATIPGTRWGDVLAAGIRAYGETGFAEEWKLHHQGGPMGYELRDWKVTPRDRRLVVENQVVGWNPSITGTKSEDTILSTGEVLTPTPDWPLEGTRPAILCRS